jgi:chromosome transmission fidelity protein 1
LHAGKVILIDEAHNLIETINQLHSAELSVPQIDAAAAAIAAYMRRYQTQLSGKNLYYINILSAVLAKVRKVLCPKAPKAAPAVAAAAIPSAPAPSIDAAGAVGSKAISTTTAATSSSTASSTAGTTTSSTLTVNDFLFKSGLDSVNLFKLKRHITETNLVNKIGGFAEAQARVTANAAGTVHIHGTAKGPAAFTAVVAALRCALELVLCLTNIEGDGRIFLLNIAPSAGSTSTAAQSTASSTTATVSGVTNVGTSCEKTATPPSVRYLMLNPSVHFASIVAQARSVVLLGGTMQPFSYFTSLLFPTVPRERLRLLSCEHVVPASQVGAMIVPYAEVDGAYSTGTSGGHASLPGTQHKRVTFEFTYDKRLQLEMTNALFAALVEICVNTPGGVVVFCTSFQYLDSLLTRWRSSRMLPKLDAIKRVLAESRASSSNTSTGTEEDGAVGCSGDTAWEGYKQQIEKNPVEGALLFSVINGKLSEGINFSDQLARCVVVVGLPYPDVRDPVLQEKMRYVSAQDTAGASGPARVGGTSVPGGSVSGSGATAMVSASSSGGSVSPAGRRLCESICMKAVNQSIGRAIRHVRDYACVVLLDRRYQQEQFRSLLPAWILRSVRSAVSHSGGGSGGSVSSAGGAGYGKQTAGAEGESVSLGKGLKDFFALQQHK